MTKHDVTKTCTGRGSKVQDRPMGFHTNEFLIRLTYKKLPIAKVWQGIKEEYSQYSERY